jgi:hypothetical protein
VECDLDRVPRMSRQVGTSAPEMQHVCEVFDPSQEVAAETALRNLGGVLQDLTYLRGQRIGRLATFHVKRGRAAASSIGGGSCATGLDMDSKDRYRSRGYSGHPGGLAERVRSRC